MRSRVPAEPASAEHRRAVRSMSRMSQFSRKIVSFSPLKWFSPVKTFAPSRTTSPSPNRVHAWTWPPEWQPLGCGRQHRRRAREIEQRKASPKIKGFLGWLITYYCRKMKMTCLSPNRSALDSQHPLNRPARPHCNLLRHRDLRLQGLQRSQDLGEVGLLHILADGVLAQRIKLLLRIFLL